MTKDELTYMDQCSIAYIQAVAGNGALYSESAKFAWELARVMLHERRRILSLKDGEWIEARDAKVRDAKENPGC